MDAANEIQRGSLCISKAWVMKYHKLVFWETPLFLENGVISKKMHPFWCEKRGISIQNGALWLAGKIPQNAPFFEIPQFEIVVSHQKILQGQTLLFLKNAPFWEPWGILPLVNFLKAEIQKYQFGSKMGRFFKIISNTLE